MPLGGGPGGPGDSRFMQQVRDFIEFSLCWFRAALHAFARLGASSISRQVPSCAFVIAFQLESFAILCFIC